MRGIGRNINETFPGQICKCLPEATSKTPHPPHPQNSGPALAPPPAFLSLYPESLLSPFPHLLRNHSFTPVSWVLAHTFVLLKSASPDHAPVHCRVFSSCYEGLGASKEPMVTKTPRSGTLCTLTLTLCQSACSSRAQIFSRKNLGILPGTWSEHGVLGPGLISVAVIKYLVQLKRRKDDSLLSWRSQCRDSQEHRENKHLHPYPH